MALSDRIAVMHQGEIMQLGAPRAVYTHPASKTVADFMGLVNLIPARVLRAAGDAWSPSAVATPLTSPCLRAWPPGRWSRWRSVRKTSA
jgi:ABC-type Fe3+/spermidine/putrescine transport system ATPase subunit